MQMHALQFDADRSRIDGMGVMESRIARSRANAVNASALRTSWPRLRVRNRRNVPAQSAAVSCLIMTIGTEGRNVQISY